MQIMEVNLPFTQHIIGQPSQGSKISYKDTYDLSHHHVGMGAVFAYTEQNFFIFCA